MPPPAPGIGRAVRLTVCGRTTRFSRQREVPLRYYGILVTFRKSWLRDWFLYEIRSGISWPRETLAETRRANPGLGAGVELQF